MAARISASADIALFRARREPGGKKLWREIRAQVDHHSGLIAITMMPWR